MNKILPAALAALVLLVAGTASAHETRTVGDGDERYVVVVGYATEPAFTEERNGLALTVRTPDDEPVENLEHGLEAELVAPTGERRTLELRAVHGRPGEYTDDVLLTEPGAYRLHVRGYIGATEVELAFDLHDVAPLDELRFP